MIRKVVYGIVGLIFAFFIITTITNDFDVVTALIQTLNFVVITGMIMIPVLIFWRTYQILQEEKAKDQ